MRSHEIEFTMNVKILLLLVASSVGAFIAKLIAPLGVFLFQEEGFFGLLTLTIVINMIVGLWKHWIQHEVDFKEFIHKTLQVVAICFLGMLLFMAIADIKGIHNTDVGEWFLLLGRVAVIMYPVGSSLKNMHYITGGKFPPLWFMGRLKKFEKTGNIKDFKN